MANRMVMGAFDGTQVLRISRPGYNVLSTGLAPKYLAFDSRWDITGRILLRGSIVMAAANTNYTVNYGLGYDYPKMPLVVARIRISSSAFLVPDYSSGFFLSMYPDYFIARGGTTLAVGVGFAPPWTLDYTVYEDAYG